MKRIYYIIAVAMLTPAIVMSVSNSAEAQRKNTTSHDVVRTSNTNENIPEKMDDIKKEMHKNYHCQEKKHHDKKCECKDHDKHKHHKHKKHKKDMREKHKLHDNNI